MRGKIRKLENLSRQVLLLREMKTKCVITVENNLALPGKDEHACTAQQSRKKDVKFIQFLNKYLLSTY